MFESFYYKIKLKIQFNINFLSKAKNYLKLI